MNYLRSASPRTTQARRLTLTIVVPAFAFALAVVVAQYASYAHASAELAAVQAANTPSQQRAYPNLRPSTTRLESALRALYAAQNQTATALRPIVAVTNTFPQDVRLTTFSNNAGSVTATGEAATTRDLIAASRSLDHQHTPLHITAWQANPSSTAGAGLTWQGIISI